MTYSYVEIVTPRASPETLGKVDYDPYGLMPGKLPAHPRTLFTADLLSDGRAAIQRGGLPRRVFDHLLTRCQPAEPLPARLGAKVDPLLNHIVADTAERNALAFHLGGNRKHLRAAQQALRLIAEAYPRWPVKNGTRADPRQDLNEAGMFMALASTFDLLLAADAVGRVDAQAFRQLMVDGIDTLRTCNHSFCGNHNLGTLPGRLASSLVLGDRQGIHDVLYGVMDGASWRYGAIHSLRHDIMGDGLHWERSFGYHGYVLWVLSNFAAILKNTGVDIWNAQLPAQMQNDLSDLHRAYGPRGPKCLRAAFDAPLYLAFANGDMPRLHDTSMSDVFSFINWFGAYHFAYDAYGDPRYAWLARRYDETRGTDPDTSLPSHIREWRGDRDFFRVRCKHMPPGRMDYSKIVRFAQAGFHDGRCSLFPVHGVAVARSRPERPGAAIFWGPHSAGHQDPAALHIDLHTGTGRITDGVIPSSYDEPLHLAWCRTTIAHNTVTVDRTPMFPYDLPTQSPWECDHWRDERSDGQLDEFQSGAAYSLVRASNETVYPGVRLDRTIITTAEYLLDIFRVCGTSTHTYDYALHLAGTATAPGPDRAARLGSGRGYDLLKNPREVSVGTPLTALDCALAGGAWTGMFYTPAGSRMFLARDPVPDKPQFFEQKKRDPLTALILRQVQSEALFVGCWVPTSIRHKVKFKIETADPCGIVTISIRNVTGARRWKLSMSDA